MNNKKTIAVAIVLALIALIGGMLAYFTDTKTAENVFTVGNVKIQLNEEGWTESTVEGEEGKYKTTDPKATQLTPGTTIDKAPTVKNIGTNDAYVFIKLEVPYTEADGELFTYTIDSTKWQKIESKEDVTGSVSTHVYAYRTTEGMKKIAKNESTDALFSNVTFKSTIKSDPSTLPSLNIKVSAYGIQSDNIEKTTESATIYNNFN